MEAPEPFLTVRVHELDLAPSLSGLCVGYELGEWRASQFVDHIMEWLPEFTLTYKELETLNVGNMVALVREAAKTVYTTEKFQKRGEFGELFLHAAMRQVFHTLPAVSKIYYESARNTPVKGFDAVHVVVSANSDLQLWLGEAKFYGNIHAAIRDVVEELRLHMDRDYLRDEFVLVARKIDDEWPHASDLRELIARNKSLDEVFAKVCIPVLLTYDSECVAEFSECSELYCEAFEREIHKHYETFRSNELPRNVDIHLFLLPLESKKQLVSQLDAKLKGYQQL